MNEQEICWFLFIFNQMKQKSNQHITPQIHHLNQKQFTKRYFDWNISFVSLRINYIEKNVWQLRRIYQNKNCFIEEKFFDIKIEKSNVSTKILFMILWFYSRVFCLLIQLFILTILSSWFLSFSLNYSFLFFLFFNWGFCHFRLNFTIFIFHIFQFW